MKEVDAHDDDSDDDDDDDDVGEEPTGHIPYVHYSQVGPIPLRPFSFFPNFDHPGFHCFRICFSQNMFQ